MEYTGLELNCGDVNDNAAVFDLALMAISQGDNARGVAMLRALRYFINRTRELKSSVLVLPVVERELRRYEKVYMY